MPAAIGVPSMSATRRTSRLLGLSTPLPAGNWSVASPVIAVNDVFGASP